MLYTSLRGELGSLYGGLLVENPSSDVDVTEIQVSLIFYVSLYAYPRSSQKGSKSFHYPPCY